MTSYQKLYLRSWLAILLTGACGVTTSEFLALCNGDTAVAFHVLSALFGYGLVWKATKKLWQATKWSQTEIQPGENTALYDTEFVLADLEKAVLELKRRNSKPPQQLHFDFGDDL